MKIDKFELRDRNNTLRCHFCGVELEETIVDTTYKPGTEPRMIVLHACEDCRPKAHDGYTKGRH